MNAYSLDTIHQQLMEQPLNSRKAPLIGITGNFGEKGCQLAKDYYQSILLAGGLPIILPPLDRLDLLPQLLDSLDGLVLSGGSDVNPLYIGQEPHPALHEINAERDAAELLLTRLAHQRALPLLGICRGIQVMAMALGGDIYQDLPSEYPSPCLKHSGQAARHVPTHTVQMLPNTRLSQCFPDSLLVNSFHHQAVSHPGPHYQVAAQSQDGVIEAIESTDFHPEIGVQWHPESFAPMGDNTMLPIFHWLIDEAALYRRTRQFHDHHLILDSHTDTPMFFAQGIQFGTRDPHVLVDMHKLHEGRVDVPVMVAYLPQGPLTTEAHQAATQQAHNLLDKIADMVDHTEGVSLAYTREDLWRHKKEGKKSILLGIENAYAFGEHLSTISDFAQKGICYATLCHNGDNLICDSASKTQHTHGGLSNYGQQVVAEMNRLGIMIDLSHTGESTFYDVLRHSTQPVICSHSSCAALCPHPRNLTDQQLRDLAAHDGVVQITCYHGFLSTAPEATIEDVVRHLLHAIEIAGITHVGFGSDFDGDGGVRGLASEAEMTLLTRRLFQAGLTEADLRLLWGENFLRVLTHNQQNATTSLYPH